MNQKAIEILVVDDHEIVHDGLRLLLRNHPEYVISATALNGVEAIGCLEGRAIDIMITDISMPEMDGISLTKQVKNLFPEVKILVLTVHHDDHTVRSILSAEAEGYILKNTGTKELVSAIEAVSSGRTFYSNEIVKSVIQGFVKEEKVVTEVAKLSPRELEILQLVVDENTTNAIAEKLFISPMTVDTHRKNILKKTETKSIVGLIKYALLHNLVKV